MEVATIKIGDLLDLSSPLATSISPTCELPRSGGTVHHRPADYTPQSSGERRERKAANQMNAVRVKVERDEEKCPNVMVRNGGICTPYRPIRVKREGGGESMTQPGWSSQNGGMRGGEVAGGMDRGTWKEGGVCEGRIPEKGMSIKKNTTWKPIALHSIIRVQRTSKPGHTNREV